MEQKHAPHVRFVDGGATARRLNFGQRSGNDSVAVGQSDLSRGTCSRGFLGAAHNLCTRGLG